MILHAFHQADIMVDLGVIRVKYGDDMDADNLESTPHMIHHATPAVVTINGLRLWLTTSNRIYLYPNQPTHKAPAAHNSKQLHF